MVNFQLLILALYSHTECYRAGQYFNMYVYCQYREIRSWNNGIADISQVKSHVQYIAKYCSGIECTTSKVNNTAHTIELMLV